MHRIGSLLLFPLVGCASMQTTTNTERVPQGWTLNAVEPGTDGEPISAEAYLQGDTVQVVARQRLHCTFVQTESTLLRETTERRISDGWKTADGVFVAIGASIVAGTAGLQLGGEGCHGCERVGYALGLPILGASLLALFIDRSRERTTTTERLISRTVRDPRPCGQVPVVAQPVLLLSPDGKRFTATTGADGRASVKLAQDGLRALKAKPGLLELWVSDRPLLLLELPAEACR